MAEAMLRTRLPETEWEVRSAGTMAMGGHPATLLACEAALSVDGVDLYTHSSTSLTAQLVVSADCVLTMSIRQAEYAAELVPEAAGRIRLYGGFVEAQEPGGWTEPGGVTAAPAEVPDPMGLDLEAYLECARQIQVNAVEWGRWLLRGAPKREAPPSYSSPLW